MKRRKPTRIGEKLLAVRRKSGLSQAQLADRLSLEIYYGRISDYEPSEYETS